MNRENGDRVEPIFNTWNRGSIWPRDEASEPGDPGTFDLEFNNSWLAILDDLSQRGCSQEETCGNCRQEPGQGHGVPFLISRDDQIHFCSNGK